MLTIFLQERSAIFLLSVIIKRIPWFSHLNVYSDLHACLITSVLWGTSRILRVIDLFSNLKFFESFLCDGKFISFQLYWSTKGLIFDILCGFFLICS